MAGNIRLLQAQDFKWLRGRLALLESIMCIICEAPTAPSPAAREVIVYQLGKTQEHRLWMPLVPAQYRITMPFWAPAVDFLLSVLLPGQGDAQHAQILPELARAVAAAVHAKQVPIQDLLGFQSFATPAENVRPNARPAIAHAFARLVLEGFVDADGLESQRGILEGARDSNEPKRQPGFKAFLHVASRHIFTLVEDGQDLTGADNASNSDDGRPRPRARVLPAGVCLVTNSMLHYVMAMKEIYVIEDLDVRPHAHQDTTSAEHAAEIRRPSAVDKVVPIILAHFRMCGELVSLNTLDLNEQQLQLTVQEIFEGCLTRLESHGLVQLVLDCAVSLLEEGLLADSSISDLVDLVASNLAELLGHQVVRLKEVLAAIEQHAALAQHGLTQALLSAILGFGLQSVLEARLVTGPQGLRDLDMKNVERLVWINFLHRVFRKSPVTQAGIEMARKLELAADAEAAASKKPQVFARAAAARDKLALRKAAAQQAGTRAAVQAAVAGEDFEEATVDAALNASELVMEEQQALELADQRRQRNAAKKARQKQRKQAQQAAEDGRLLDYNGEKQLTVHCSAAAFHSAASLP